MGRNSTSAWWLVLFLLGSQCNFAIAQDEAVPSYAEERSQNYRTWRALLDERKFDELEQISASLRSQLAKTRNGRGKDWQFYWTPLSENSRQMRDEDYQQSLAAVEEWLKAKPDSVSARLAMAHVWHRYSFFARGARVTGSTTDEQLDLFAERNKKAAKYLDEIARNPEQIDNVYRRLRMEIAKGLGIKPDVQLVYDGLKADPLNMELVHGMTICLLPRWFGEPGELEKFADEVVRRTRETSGEFQYITVVLATKAFLKEYVLLTHEFDLQRIGQGFRDLERLYPHAREFLDDEAQLLYLAGDVAGAYAALQKIGKEPNLGSWSATDVDFAKFSRRITPELTEGDQTRIITGATKPYFRIQSLGNDQIIATLDSVHGTRLYDFQTGAHREWVWLQDINSRSSGIHPQTGLITGGSLFDPGIMIYSLANGRFGQLPADKKVSATSISSPGNLLAAADESGLISVFDLQTGAVKFRFPAETPRFITMLAFSPDDSQLGASTRGGELLVFNLKDEKLQSSRKVANTGLKCLAWSEKHIAIGSAGGKAGGEVIVFDRQTFEQVALWKPKQPATMAALDFSPDGEQLAIGRSSDNSEVVVNQPLSVWRFQHERAPTPLVGHKLGVNCVRFVEQGQGLLSGSHDWTLRYWKVPQQN